MKTFRSALLAAAVLAGIPSVALALPVDGDQEAPTRFERGPGARADRADRSAGQTRPQFQPQQRQDFGGRPDFSGSRPDQPQVTAPAPTAAQVDGQRQPGSGRFGRPDSQPGGFDRRPDNRGGFGDRRDNGARRNDNDRFDNGNRFGNPNGLNNNQFRGGPGGFANNNRFQGNDRRFDSNNRFDGPNNRFDNNNRLPGGNRFQPDWRNDRRYDWRGWRNNNRQLFRAPRYLAPRGYGYGYRPFARGYQLQPFFYGQNYWINDPWQYRLPPAYGPYRWVRYYNDVLLVDINSGFVVDVIQNFFW